MKPVDPEWNQVLFRAWGRSLTRHHEAARTFSVPTKTWRSNWHLEPGLREGLDRIDVDDAELAREAHSLLSELDRRASKLGEMTMVYGDHAPQNFRYDRALVFTTFDGAAPISTGHGA